MKIFEGLISNKFKMAVIGLGYVGMPLAYHFSKKIDVIGYDINSEKIDMYRNGIDPTNEIGNNKIKDSNIDFTSDEKDLKDVKIFIVAVPTPINQDKTPNLEPIESSASTVGRNISKGSIVVFESTVYPGVTEDICVPILEKESGLKCGLDFKVGYSPERINPGDEINTLDKIVKIVSGIDKESLDEIAKIYELIIDVGVHKAESIKVAEAAKVVENSQRDINIAFMNELAMVFNKMNIDTNEVLKAMNTKWNALKFTPGLVGGHCIGVDPYYFLYEAEKLGYHSQIIQSGRKINDGMGRFIGEAIIKELVLANKIVKESRIGILGITFKENCPDTRNSKVIDIIDTLKEYGIAPLVSDYWADKNQVKKEYGINLVDDNELSDLDCLIIAVEHAKYYNLEISKYNRKKTNLLIVDIKSLMNKSQLIKEGYKYWNL